jgi:hypothetical protein
MGIWERLVNHSYRFADGRCGMGGGVVGRRDGIAVQDARDGPGKGRVRASARPRGISGRHGQSGVGHGQGTVRQRDAVIRQASSACGWDSSRLSRSVPSRAPIVQIADGFRRFFDKCGRLRWRCPTAAVTRPNPAVSSDIPPRIGSRISPRSPPLADPSGELRANRQRFGGGRFFLVQGELDHLAQLGQINGLKDQVAQAQVADHLPRIRAAETTGDHHGQIRPDR